MCSNRLGFLAARLHALQQPRFHLEPSLHLLKHIGLRLRTQLEAGATHILNPATFLAEAGEDFIGKVARISRRVSARLTSQRTMQRILVKTCADWRALKT